MKYLISNRQDLAKMIGPIFQEQYFTFLKNDVYEVFPKVLNSSLCFSTILKENKVMAFCFHRVMECVDWRTPPEYLSETPEEFRKYIERKFLILTIEWLTVAPEFTGKFKKVQPADLILGCGITFMKNSICNAAMGFSRQDNRTDIMTTRFGTRIFGTIDKFDVPCSIVLVENYSVKSHPIAKTQETINELWNQRVNDFTDLERKIAA